MPRFAADFLSDCCRIRLFATLLFQLAPAAFADDKKPENKHAAYFILLEPGAVLRLCRRACDSCCVARYLYFEAWGGSSTRA
ncbi:hypothetical protein [Candidatus Pantoea persica]|uniref:hypothetical protein n=1 Tax=Candidatus Pantoea persica TaxID=2518128 RepID=UPI00215D80BC|nr:hypothetical protein [Candidatus Pantoea persica]